MAVHRIHKTENYTVMSNVIFKDRRLSYKAKGLHAMMMSLPDYWDYSTEGLVTLSTDGKTSVISALKELEDCGYLVRTQARNNGVFSGYIYDIYEVPQNDKPSTDLPSTRNPTTANQSQLNTKVSNTKKSKASKGKKFVPPTLNEVEEYAKEKALVIDPQFFYEYFTEGDWHDAKGNPVKNWKTKMLTWNKQELEKHPEKANQEKIVFV